MRPLNAKVKAITLLMLISVSMVVPAEGGEGTGTESATLPFAADSLRITPRSTFHSLHFPGAAHFYDESLIGKPRLPVRRFYFVLPPDAQIENVRTVRRGTAIVVDNVVPLPFLPRDVEGPQDSIAVSVMDSDIYDSTQPYPERPFWVQSQGYLRGVQLVAISVTPLEYVGAYEQLRIYPLTDVEISWTAGASASDRGVTLRSPLRARWTLDGFERALCANMPETAHLPEFSPDARVRTAIRCTRMPLDSEKALGIW